MGAKGPLIFYGGESRHGKLHREVGTLTSLAIKDMSPGVSLPGSHHLLVILWASYLTSLSLFPYL